MDRKIIRRWVLRLSAATLVLAAAPSALAHPGHDAPQIQIDKPSAGSLTLKDVEVGKKPDGIGPDVPAVASSGDDLTIAVSWTCPAGAGGAAVQIVVTDADGADVHNAGYGALGATSSYSTTWEALQAGSYTITTTVECYRWDNRTQPPVRISMGTDTDTRSVTVL